MEKGDTGSEKRFDSAISKSLCSVVNKTVNKCKGLFSVYWNYLEVRRKNRSLSRHSVTRYSQLTYVIATGVGFNAIIYYVNQPNFHFCCIHVHPQVAKQVNTEKLIFMRLMYNI